MPTIDHQYTTEAKRRSVLKAVGGSIGTGVLAGHTVTQNAAAKSQEKIADIELNEISGDPHSIYAKVTRHTDSGDTVLFEDTVQLDGDEVRRFYDVIEKNTNRHTVEFSLDGGERHRGDISTVAKFAETYSVHFSVDPDGSLSVSTLHVDLFQPKGVN